jgi:ribulose 1,5-bisphosphate synthetase/thiazole synthase
MTTEHTEYCNVILSALAHVLASVVEATVRHTQRSNARLCSVTVGAGPGDLQAARGVHAAGLSALVLEAKDPVGAKTWSRPTAEVAQET